MGSAAAAPSVLSRTVMWMSERERIETEGEPPWTVIVTDKYGNPAMGDIVLQAGESVEIHAHLPVDEQTMRRNDEIWEAKFEAAGGRLKQAREESDQYWQALVSIFECETIEDAHDRVREAIGVSSLGD